jgi:hypothetical protein
MSRPAAVARKYKLRWLSRWPLGIMVCISRHSSLEGLPIRHCSHMVSIVSHDSAQKTIELFPIRAHLDKIVTDIRELCSGPLYLRRAPL